MDNMKTAREYFCEELPRSICYNAIWNLDHIDGAVDSKCYSLLDALLTSFKWDLTQEGVSYWHGVYECVELGIDLKGSKYDMFFGRAKPWGRNEKSM